MRDHRNLRASQMANKLCLAIYATTRDFPRDELFGLRAQVRRAAVSVVSNIVEGAGRHSEADFLHFLDMAFGSLREVEYQVSLAKRLGYFADPAVDTLDELVDETVKVLRGLIVRIREGGASV